jgi:simple sugar transport system permease protein
MQAIAAAIIGGTLLTGGVGNVIGTLFGVLSLKTIPNIVIASGLREPYWQSITTGLMLFFFIVLQSVVLTLRDKGGFKLKLPEWIRFKSKENRRGSTS